MSGMRHWGRKYHSIAQHMQSIRSDLAIIACAGLGHACDVRRTHVQIESRGCDSAAARRKTKEACVRVQLRRKQQLAARSASDLLEARQTCQAGQACVACCSELQSGGGPLALHSAAPVPAAQEGDCEIYQHIGSRHGW